MPHATFSPSKYMRSAQRTRSSSSDSGEAQSKFVALHRAGAEIARRRPDSTVDRSAWGQPEGTWLVTFLNTDGAFEQALPALHAKVRAAAVAVDRAQWNLTAGVADGQLNYRVAEYHTMRSELDDGQPLPDPTLAKPAPNLALTWP